MTVSQTRRTGRLVVSDSNSGEMPKCGIIMPISATTNHSDQHWADVQKLLHRAISKAGFQPVNVWLNEATDRISERIIGNLFSHDLIVADISDLNPNVMLELGLRLASRKPTVVVVKRGSTIPFDIRDFHALDYPGDLNILDMETFFDRLAETLNSKHKAFVDGEYIAFLGGVVVDVLSPQTRNIPIDSLILSRLDDIDERFRRLEKLTSEKRPTISPRPSTHWKFQINVDFLTASQEQIVDLENAVDGVPGLMTLPTRRAGRTNGLQVVSADRSVPDMILIVKDLAAKLGIDSGELLIAAGDAA